MENTLTISRPYVEPPKKKHAKKKKVPATKQVGGKHYSKYPIQPWRYIQANKLDYMQGSIVSYVTRWKDKGGIEDLEKAVHFLEEMIRTAKHGTEH